MENENTNLNCESLRETDSNNFVFDDEPLEAILYGDLHPNPGPSSADAFIESRSKLTIVKEVMAQKDNERALIQIVELLETKKPIPIEMLYGVVSYLIHFIPDYPCPIVEEHGIAYNRILGPCFELGCKNQNEDLTNSSGTLLYRWYEGYGFYQQAAGIVSALLNRVSNGEGSARQALLINNLGYEFLLDQRWGEALPYFKRSVEIYERIGDEGEAANIHANELLCELGIHGVEYLVYKKKRLKELTKILRDRSDWRIRKPLGLLSRVYEFEGKLKYAVKYAHLAAKAGKNIPSHHYVDDKAYLTELQEKYDCKRW